MKLVPVLIPVLILVLPLPLAACGGDDDADDTFTVLAAASLTEAFSDLAADFEADHDGIDVELSFGSSTDLAETVADDAPGDVLATADETSIQVAQDAGVTTEDPTPFATNQLVIVTPPGNPGEITALVALDGATWVRCADDVPCGRVALTLLEAAGVAAEPASLEVDARATLEKVTAGEADAGLVYASDAVAAGDTVEVVDIEGAEAALTTYYLAPLEQAGDADLAADWVELVTSGGGQESLTGAGFSLP